MESPHENPGILQADLPQDRSGAFSFQIPQQFPNQLNNYVYMIVYDAQCNRNPPGISDMEASCVGGCQITRSGRPMKCHLSRVSSKSS